MTEQTYSHYKNRINTGEDFLSIVKEARKDYGVNTNYNQRFEYEGRSIPFNLEREYILYLVENRDYSTARKFLENMKFTYRDAASLNFIEMYEYHVHAVEQSEKTLKESMSAVKKEFNQHTITIIGIIVGVITILGAANQTFQAKNFEESINAFFSITLAIYFVIISSFFANSFFSKRK